MTKPVMPFRFGLQLDCNIRIRFVESMAVTDVGSDVQPSMRVAAVACAPFGLPWSGGGRAASLTVFSSGPFVQRSIGLYLVRLGILFLRVAETLMEIEVHPIFH